jgi:hypothetical protein
MRSTHAGWQFEATFRHEDAIYEILVKNPRQLCGGLSQIMVDETPLGPEKMGCPARRGRKKHRVRVILGAPAAVKEKSLEH